MAGSGPASPSILNYTVGKGIASFKEDGEVSYRDLGNVTVFEFSPSVEKLDHFSSRAGIKAKDRSVIVSTEGELKMTMDETTLDNLRIVLAGDIDTNSAGNRTMTIMSRASVSGAIKFVGTNDIGQKMTWIFPKVTFNPDGTVSPLSDEWGELEATGEVLYDATLGAFGTIEHTGGEGFEADSSS